MGSIELGYPVSSIAKIEFPEPSELKSVPDLLLHGKATEALTQLGPVVQSQEPFRAIPGNWWVQAAQLKLTALLSLQRDFESESLIQQLSQLANNPDATWTAKVQKAAMEARKKNYDSATAVFDSAIAECKSPEILAYAWLNKAHILLAKRAFEPALLAYLRISVLYPNQRFLLPAALIGSAHAYRGLGDENEARRTLTEEASKYPDAPETAAAKAELEKFKSDNTTP
jgi:tetratricopeptide (TPR) repeat protein